MNPSPNIEYIVGDATTPVSYGPAVVVHVCNDVGGWGRGFVLAISAKWKAPEEAYRRWYSGDGQSFGLGEVQSVQVEPHLWVANMVAQHDVRRIGGSPPIRYDALRSALIKVAAFCLGKSATAHMPRIGCGLAGGQWSEVSRLIDEELTAKEIPVTVYDLETK
jgi:O-acetyl-ADP-ribose deacetylase (regulator of RNase III)